MNTLSARSLKLYRFTPEGALPNPNTPNIEVEIKRLGLRTLALSYHLCGDLSHIQWPQHKPAPSRKMALWQTSCFECFISPINKTHYAEFNVSPSGDWNSFHFSGYRAGMREDQNLVVQDVRFTAASDAAHLSFTIESIDEANVTSELRIGISVILLDDKNRYHYYALAHPPKAPDFHAPLGHLDLFSDS